VQSAAPEQAKTPYKKRLIIINWNDNELEIRQYFLQTLELDNLPLLQKF